ncbi:MAG: PAS domain S-box protein [Nitrospirota bacterium]
MPDAKILIVEDEAIEAMDIQQRLVSLGYPTPDIANSGEESVRKAEEARPDLVLMDIMMPGKMDGVTAAEQIRSRFDIPIVYLTAYADENTLRRAKVTEPHGYIVKPFQERELHITIDMALYKHRMERELKAREKWLATTLRSIGDAVIATDEKGLITFINPVAEELMGWKLEEVRQRNLTEVLNIVNRDTRKPVENPVTRVILEGNVVGLANHTVLISRDGREIPINDSAAPIKDEKGKILGVVLVFSDITEREKAQEALMQEVTERKRAEKALQKAHDELEMRVKERTNELAVASQSVKAERQRLYAVLETLPAYVVLLTSDYHVPFANRFFRERFGESHGKRCFEYLFNRTEPCEICETYSVLKTMQPHHWEWTGPDSRDYDIYDYPFVDSSGSILILEMGIDITEQKRAQQALRAMNETLEQRITERTEELRAANETLRASRTAALNLMDDAIVARERAQRTSLELQHEITERKQAEELLRESEQRLARAQEIAHLGSWELDLVKNELTWSDEVYRIFGLQPQEFSATYEAFLEGVHPDDRAAVDSAYSASVKEGKDSYEIEHRIVREGTGEVRWVHEKCQHYRDSSGRIICSVGMVHDVTERKQAEEALRKSEERLRLALEEVRRSRDQLEIRVMERTHELSSLNEELLQQIDERARAEESLRASEERLRYLTTQLMTAQEQERRRLSRELHDELGQALSLMKLRVRYMRQHLREDQQALSEEAGNLLTYIDDVIENVRRLSRDLSPSILEDLGLTAAIRRLISGFAKHNDHIHVDSDITDIDNIFSREAQINIYRIIQEAITNVERHAQADRMHLTVLKDDQIVSFLVEDNGKGFEQHETADKVDRGMGLIGMRERAWMLGGTIDIKSGQNNGTSVGVHIPIEPEKR